MDRQSALEIVYQAVRPSCTLEQYRHCIEADPALNGSTYREYATARLLVNAVALLLDIDKVASGEVPVAMDNIEVLYWIQKQWRKLLDTWQVPVLVMYRGPGREYVQEVQQHVQSLRPTTPGIATEATVLRDRANREHPDGFNDDYVNYPFLG